MRWPVTLLLSLVVLLTVAPLRAQAPSPPAMSDRASDELVAGWQARDSLHNFACLYAHLESATVIAVDSVGPSGPAASVRACPTGATRYVDERGEEKVVFSDIMMALLEHPTWLIGAQVYGILQGDFGGHTVVPLALSVLNFPTPPPLPRPKA